MYQKAGAKTMQCADIDVNDLRKLRGEVIHGNKEIDTETRLVDAMRAVGMIPDASHAPAFTPNIARLYLQNRPQTLESTALT